MSWTDGAPHGGGTLNRTAEYALRAVLHLATRVDAGPIPAVAIAQALDVPHNYLSKVLHVLAREGVLTSLRGPRGGFRLSRHAGRLTLGHVIQPFDPIEDRCLLRRRSCSDADPCLAHHEWKSVAAHVRGFFRHTTVSELVDGGAAVGNNGGANNGANNGGSADTGRLSPPPWSITR